MDPFTDVAYFRFERAKPEGAKLFAHLDAYSTKLKTYHDFATRMVKELGVSDPERYGLAALTGDGFVDRVPIVSVALHCKTDDDINALLAKFPSKTFTRRRSRHPKYMWEARFRVRSKEQKHIAAKAKEEGHVGVVPDWPRSIREIKLDTPPAEPIGDATEFFSTHPGVSVLTQDDLILSIQKERTAWVAQLEGIGGQRWSASEAAALLEAREPQ